MRDWTIAYALVATALVSACAADDPCASGEPGTVCRVAGTGTSGFNGDGLAATESELSLPSQVKRGADGLLYVMDMNNMLLRRVEADGTMSSLLGNGVHGGAEIGAPARETPLDNPLDFDWLADGRLVFVQAHDPRLIAIGSDGRLQLLSNELTGTIGNEGDGGPLQDARFIELSGVVVAPDGTMFIADKVANRVRVVRDGIITTYAGTGLQGFEGDGGRALDAQLSQPTALALDAAGNLYITDTGNCAVRRVSPDGTIMTVAGIGYAGFGGDGGPATRAMLAHPEGIAIAPDGSFYIGDRYNNRVRHVAPDGTITTVAGTGDKGMTGDGGSALEAQFGRLARVQLDSDGGLLVADQTNAIVRKILAAP